MSTQFRRVPLHLINPAPYNPRVDLKPGDPRYEKLRRSIEDFGLVEPLVWNEQTGNLVGGHQRLRVLTEQGVQDVEVVVVDLTPEREKALNLALNKIQGDWDQEKLGLLLDELSKIPEFDFGATGFDLPDIQALVASALHTTLAEKEETFDVAKAFQEEGPAITKPGELIELGRHRVLCGDSSDPNSIRRVVDGSSAHLLFTDPPYNVSYLGGNRPSPQKARPKRSRAWKRIYGDNLSQEEYSVWLGKVFTNVKPVLAPGAPLYIWNGHRQFGPMHELLGKLGVKVSCVITWAKPNFAIGFADYQQQTEFCLYGWIEENGAHRWFGPTNESTLWEIDRDPTKTYQHPTQKPLELAERAIRNSSQPGDIVLDTFLGSGTTLLASERTGRRCFGIELDPRYVDVIVRRHIAFVGEKAVASEIVERYRVRKEVVQ